MLPSLWHNVRRRIMKRKFKKGKRGFIYLHSKLTTIKIRIVP